MTAQIKTPYSYQIPLTGFSITVPNWCQLLSLNPAGTLATGTVTFPITPDDQQDFVLASTQIVTTLTLTAGNAAIQSILGGITTIGANARIRWVFNSPAQLWVLG